MPVHNFTGVAGSGLQPPPSGVRDRPFITGTSIHTDTGTPFRGGSMDIRKQTNPVCTQQAVWNNWRAAGLNIARIDVKTDVDGVGRSVAAQLPFLDAAVDCAEAAHMYIQPHPSIHPGNYSLAQLNAFWPVVSARYANRTHVIFEMYNEPTANSTTKYWGDAGSWTDAKLRDFRGVYDVIRANAPNTHVILFSTTNLAPNPTAWRTVPERFNTYGSGPMSWDNVSIGFHFYNGTYNFGAPNGFGGLQVMRDLGYKLWMSECNDFIGDNPSSEPRNHQLVWLWLEQFGGVPWDCLDGKSGTINTQITSEILPYISANGFPINVE